MNNVMQKLTAALACLALVVAGFALRNTSAPATVAGASTENSTIAYTPKAHAAQHLSTGSDPISDATTGADGLFAAADKTVFNQFHVDGLHSRSERRDDFRSGTTGGQMNWRVTNPATGNTVIQTATNQDSTHLGILRMPTGNTSSTQSALTTFEAGPILDFQPDATAQTNLVECKIRFETLSTSAQRYKWRCGYETSSVLSPTDEIAVEYDESTDAHFQIVVCNTSTCSSGKGTTTVAANTWYRVSATHTAGSSSWALNVNGTQEATVSTNVATAQLGLGVSLIKSVGTTDINTYLDYVQETIVWPSGR